MECEYRKTILENGIRVVTEKIPAVRSIAIGAWITVGSRDETVDNNGISHYIEHMMFKGTKSRKAYEIAESLESVGGHLNAFTSKELTCYYAHILDEHLSIAIDVISDILIDSVFDETEMQKEKQVIIEEINNLEDTPEELVHELFIKDLFPEHPLGFSTLGTRENVRNFDRVSVLDYVSRNYATDRLVIAAAGNVDHDTLVGMVDERFKKLPNGSQRNYVPPRGQTKGVKIIENDGIQAHICVGTQAYPYRDHRKFALLVLNTLLGSGMSSRLFQNIREKYGLAYSVYSFIDFMLDTGLFGVYIGTDKNKIDDSIELINKELQQLRETPISEEELSRTKSQLKGNLMLGLESTSSRMTRLAKMEIYLDNYFTLDDTLLEIERVTFEEILQVANELFDPNRLFTTILKPQKNGISPEGNFNDSRRA